MNSKTGQEYLEFLIAKRFLTTVMDSGKTSFVSTQEAGEYIALFSLLYQRLFDTPPDFRL
jgi:hypothetical protein